MCWKGDYWNLGAGAEIGIYYNNDAQRAEDGYYEIDTENLLVHAIMNVTYDGKYITTNFEQTNWWVTSFTPAYQHSAAEQIGVDLKVRFTDNPFANDSLVRNFYNKRNALAGTAKKWSAVSPSDYSYKSRPIGHTGATHRCGNPPPLCTCTCKTAGCGNPCTYFTDVCTQANCADGHHNDPYNGFQFNVTY